jgi:hypothetical protein
MRICYSTYSRSLFAASIERLQSSLEDSPADIKLDQRFTEVTHILQKIGISEAKARPSTTIDRKRLSSSKPTQRKGEMMPAQCPSN